MRAQRMGVERMGVERMGVERMGANHQLAIQELEKFCRVFQAFNEAKNAVASLASLDQNVSELEKRKGLLLAEIEEVEKEKQISKETLEKDKQLNLKSYQEQRVRLDRQTTQLIQKLNHDYNDAKTTLEQEFIQLEDKIKQAESVLSKTVSEVQTKSTELTLLETKIIETKKYITTLLSST